MAKPTSKKQPVNKTPPGKGTRVAPKARPNMEGAKGRGLDMTQRNSTLLGQRLLTDPKNRDSSKNPGGTGRFISALNQRSAEAEKSGRKGTYYYDPKKKK